MKNNLYLLQLIEHSEKQIAQGKITEQKNVFANIEKKYFSSLYIYRIKKIKNEKFFNNL